MITTLFDRLKKTIENEPELLNQARIRILIITITAFVIKRAVLLAAALSSGGNIYLWRATFIFIFFAIAMFLLFYRKSWKIVAHFFLIALTFAILSNVMLFKAGTYMITVQNIAMVISISYYLLGTRYGLIYSLINILFLASTTTLIPDKVISLIPVSEINPILYGGIFVFNFLILIYIHAIFLRAFKLTNQKATQLNIDLQAALKQAQVAAEAKVNFLATMSHELRTPLNAVLGMVNIILEASPRKDQVENLEILRFSAENLMDTINDVLDFSRIDTGNMQLSSEDFILVDTLKKIQGTFKAAASNKNIQLIFTIDPKIEPITISGDQARLTQILFNLIGNAIKFTSKGYVSLEAKVMHQDKYSMKIRFIISDTGVGIPKEKQVDIFEPFSHIPARTDRQYHGTGIGLSIASRLVKLHNSELTFSSTEGQGTTFNFEINYCLSEAKDNLQKVIPVKLTALHQLRVLAAEDNPINVIVLKKMLNNWGIVPAITENGQEAVAAVADGDFDVVLMDINMPVMDGFEASENIRKMPDPVKSSIPIIAITASIGAPFEDLPGFRYIDDCLLKPFIPEELHAILQQVMAGTYTKKAKTME